MKNITIFKIHNTKLKFFIFLIMTLMLISKTYATNYKSEYDFFITKDNILGSNEQKLEFILSNSVNKKSLVNKKIAPRN